ncbi:electron transfer flavoprotein subunit alpha/FixB family protein [Candidatus Bathyarchaeota archaeon]|nr:electron transfer flavoprotein subunit alpha/FixB family protein [Candidatus Bathyarchaeota archaeon]
MEEGGVMVFAEQEDGMVHPITYELLGKGRELAEKLGKDLSSVLLGYNIEKEALELIYHGADTVFLYDHPSLKDFDVIRYKQNIVSLLKEEKADIFLLGATPIGRSLGPRVAAAMETGLTADCIELDIDGADGSLVQIRPAFSGNIIARIKTRTKPQMATVRYKVMKRSHRDTMRKGRIVRREVKEVSETGIHLLKKEPLKGVDISEAEVIVSGGRGLRKPEDFKLLEELSRLLGGTVGSSRPLVDEGWIGREHQVGFSGNTVKPKVYIACGISGSPQHLFGMRDSEVIIAINKDPSAPIFKFSDYCIIGDLYEVLPALIREIKKSVGE